MATNPQEYLVRKKIEYILLRYKLDSKKLTPALKIELLKRWIQSCVDSEEYEMAIVLKTERNKIIRLLRIKKIGKRTFLQKIKIIFAWKKRRFTRLFFPQ
jgi:hypothetical protein